MLKEKLDIEIPDIEIFCRKWKIDEFFLFGSVLRDDFRPDSDVDVLITLSPKAEWDLFDWVDMKNELEALFDRNVDLVEKSTLKNPYRRREILAHRELIYAA
jgi:predicted nucleotidyltransferase